MEKDKEKEAMYFKEQGGSGTWEARTKRKIKSKIL